MDRHLARLSRFLSLILRHDPGRIGLELDGAGWANADALVGKAAAVGVPLTHDLLKRIVAENAKQRFAWNEDGTRIRASQGHSLPVDLDLEPVEPPPLLFHGTTVANLASIRATGIHAGKRNHVHLSPDEETAKRVGQRHGKPVALSVRSRQMHTDGHLFYRSANGVWLTGLVPPAYIDVPPTEDPG